MYKKYFNDKPKSKFGTFSLELLRAKKVLCFTIEMHLYFIIILLVVILFLLSEFVLGKSSARFSVNLVLHKIQIVDIISRKM